MIVVKKIKLVGGTVNYGLSPKINVNQVRNYPDTSAYGSHP